MAVVPLGSRTGDQFAPYFRWARFGFDVQLICLALGIEGPPHGQMAGEWDISQGTVSIASQGLRLVS